MAAKTGDELTVGGWEIVGGQTLGLDPFHGLLLARHDLPRLLPAVEEVKHDRAVGVLPADGLDEVPYRERRGELLLQLPAEPDRRGLSGLELPSGNSQSPAR